MGEMADMLDWAYPEMEIDRERENEWASGYHTDQTGKVWKLSEMADSHLTNTIRYFSDYDTSPLELELKSRSKYA